MPCKSPGCSEGRVAQERGREGGREGERPCGTMVWEAASENLLVDLVNALASRAK